MVLKYSFDLFFLKCIFEFMINTAPDKVQTVRMTEKDTSTLLIFKVNLHSGHMALWSETTLFSLGCRFKSRCGYFQFFFLSSFFYPSFLVIVLRASYSLLCKCKYLNETCLYSSSKVISYCNHSTVRVSRKALV